MTQPKKEDLKRQVVREAREYGIGSVLFRHVLGEMLGLNATDMECLGVIFFKGVPTPSELAQYTGLSSGATTAMLDRLEKARLIERRPNPLDRRGTLIVLTNERIEELRAIFASGSEAINRLTASYSEDALATIADYFRRLVTVWEDEREKLKQYKAKD